MTVEVPVWVLFLVFGPLIVCLLIAAIIAVWVLWAHVTNLVLYGRK